MAGMALLTIYAGLSADPLWNRLPDVSGTSKPVKGGGGIVALGDDVYLVPGNNTLDFAQFSISGNTWSAITPGVPQGDKEKRVKKGAYLVADNPYIYVFKGASTNEFYRYSTLAGTWEVLPQPDFTKGIKGGFATLVNMGGKKYIYAGSGSNTSEWKKFNIETSGWEAAMPAALPFDKVKVGSGLAFDGAGKLYFLLGGGKTCSFFVTDLLSPAPVWTQKADMSSELPGPKKKARVKEGGCIDWHVDRVYGVKGNLNEFWSFDPATEAWSFLGNVGGSAVMPTKKIKCGRSLAAAANGIYCVIGNNTNEFWFYGNPTDGVAPKLNATGADVGQRGSLRLVPNPTRGIAGASIDLHSGSDRLRIYDNSGKLVHGSVISGGRFSTPQLPAGIYVVAVESNGRVRESRLTVVD
jgi:hypothetical protein